MCARNTAVDLLVRSEDSNSVVRIILKIQSWRISSGDSYLKSDCEALTSKPGAFRKALSCNSDVHACCDLFAAATRVRVVDHLHYKCEKSPSNKTNTHARKKDLFIGVEQVVSSTICGISIRGVIGKILPCSRVQRLADCLSQK